MKARQRLILGLFVSAFSLLISSPVQAAPKVTFTPTTLTVTGKRCLIAQVGCTTAQRNLLLRTDQAVADLKILSTDLNNADGTQVVPADKITINSSKSTAFPTKLDANQPVTIPVNFNFQNVASGEYSGILLVTFGDGEVTIPITVKVKDYWLVPLLVLLLGVGLGVAISAYRTEGMTRDEVLIKVSRLRNQMRSDDKLDNSFQTKIEAYLVEVETALENKQWQVAEQAVIQAQSVWNKWRQGRTDWIDLLQSESQLKEFLNTENPEDSEQQIPYLQRIRWQLESIRRETVNLESPQKLSESLQEVREQINRYLQGKIQYEEFNKLRNKLPQSAPDEKREFWRLEVLNLQQQLENLSPTDKDGFNQWQDEVKKKSQELIEDIKATKEQSTDQTTNQQTIIIARNIDKPTPNNQLEPIPTAEPFTNKNLEKLAKQRLRWFNIVSYIIAITLLAGAGFTQLYAVNKTFGANGLADYFALLAWGFGAEATRETVTKALQDWKLPGLKPKS